MELDLKRASRVYGSSAAAWFLDGQYFTGDGQPISFEEAAKPLPEDLPEPKAPESTELPSYEIISAKPAQTVPEYTAVVDTPIERDTKEDATYGDNRFLKLKPLSGTVLAAMVMRAGGTPETGYGSKKRNIAWLLENVKD